MESRRQSSVRIAQEPLVVALFACKGYAGSLQEAAQALGGSGDGRIERITKDEEFGLNVVYLQAKR